MILMNILFIQVDLTKINMIYLQDSSSSKWDDAVFIPPGFDLATSSKQSNHDN
jgi:hypothetical protein